MNNIHLHCYILQDLNSLILIVDKKQNKWDINLIN